MYISYFLLYCCLWALAFIVDSCLKQVLLRCLLNRGFIFNTFIFNTCNFFCEEQLSFPHLCVYIRASHGFLFYDPRGIIAITYFVALIASVLAIGSSFNLASMSFLYILIILCASPGCLASQNVPVSSCTFADLDLEWAVSLRSLVPFIENGL